VRAQPGHCRGSRGPLTDEHATSLERRPQSLVVTLLGSYVHPEKGTVWSGGLVNLLGELGFSAGAARAALTRLTRRDLLERVRDGRLVHYRLTDRAATLLDEGERRIFSLGRDARPAEAWTILWHATPEERRLERGRLGQRLRFLGFGSLQDGVWVSPHDHEREAAALLEELGLARYAAVLVGRPASGSDFAAFVARAWDVELLAKRYRAFVTAFGGYAPSRRNGFDDREAFLVRTRLVHDFRQFPFLDPGLPEDFFPTQGQRARAVDLFHQVYASLAEPAHRHFDATVVPPRRRSADS
jgi:phenylacetic acid degradation operon negative regulatory protein